MTARKKTRPTERRLAVDENENCATVHVSALGIDLWCHFDGAINILSLGWEELAEIVRNSPRTHRLPAPTSKAASKLLTDAACEILRQNAVRNAVRNAAKV